VAKDGSYASYAVMASVYRFARDERVGAEEVLIEKAFASMR